MSGNVEASASVLERNYRRAVELVRETLVDCGRPQDAVRIIGVTKYVDVQRTRQLVEAGCRILGESRPQALWQKHAALSEPQLASDRTSENANSAVPAGQIEWHLIGHLQRNKAARTVPLIDWLHSLDSLRLAETLSSEASKLGRPLKVLVEVNATEDTSKTGLAPTDLAPLMERLLELPGLQVRGLMAMSTEHASADQALREFTSICQLRDRLQQQFGAAVDLRERSMGMSGDFVAGIQAGATMVRLGSILWEGVST
jgi:pyridoxal phosphate enzyme (YggS family)